MVRKLKQITDPRLEGDWKGVLNDAELALTSKNHFRS